MDLKGKTLWIAIVVVGGCSGPSGHPSGVGPSGVTPRARPAVGALDRLRLVEQALRKALQKKTTPRLENVLGEFFETFPRECRGLLRTDLGLHVIPRTHPGLPTAQLQPGLIFVLKGLTPAPPERPRTPSRPAASRPTPRGRATGPELEEGLCAVTVTTGAAGRPAGLQLVPVPTSGQSPKKVSFEWQEFPRGNVLLSVVEEEGEDRSQKGEVSRATTVSLIRYHAGRFEMLTGCHRKMVMRSKESTSTVTQRLKLLSVGKPPHHLLLRIGRSVMVAQMKEPVEMGDPSHGTSTVVMRGVTVTMLSETYGVWSFNSNLSGIHEVKGKAREALLALPALAPYRKPIEKTTREWDQDD